MKCEDRSVALSALLDGELPPAEVAALAGHLATCPACAQRLAGFAALRAEMAAALPREPAPARLIRDVEALLAAPVPVRRARGGGWRRTWLAIRPPRAGFAGFALGAALAACLILVVPLVSARPGTAELAGLRDAVLRTALTGAPAAPLPALPDGAPPIPGFRLMAARADRVAGHRAAILTYHAATGGDVTLAIWAARGEPAHAVRDAAYRGLAIRYWNDGRREFWAVSEGLPVLLAAFTQAARHVAFARP